MQYLFLLACPIGMGLMMWMMMRGQQGQQGSTPSTPSTGTTKTSSAGAQDSELRTLRAQVKSLKNQQATLLAEIRKLSPADGRGAQPEGRRNGKPVEGHPVTADDQARG